MFVQAFIRWESVCLRKSLGSGLGKRLGSGLGSGLGGDLGRTLVSGGGGGGGLWLPNWPHQGRGGKRTGLI